jgi:hypothetical protein
MREREYFVGNKKCESVIIITLGCIFTFSNNRLSFVPILNVYTEQTKNKRESG